MLLQTCVLLNFSQNSLEIQAHVSEYNFYTEFNIDAISQLRKGLNTKLTVFLSDNTLSHYVWSIIWAFIRCLSFNFYLSNLYSYSLNSYL